MIILRTLHASHKQSALHKLIEFNHTTLERKTARHMLFHLIAPSPYIIRNLPQLLQPTDFCVQYQERKKKKAFLELNPKGENKTKLNVKLKAMSPKDLKVSSVTHHHLSQLEDKLSISNINGHYKIYELLNMFNTA